MKTKQYQEHASYSLMARTLELLDADDRSVLEIHHATGISFYWLRKFKARTFVDPSVNKVQFLYEHLTNAKLAV